MISDRVREALAAVPLDDVLTVLQEVTEYDRYQASQGIQDAAVILADHAERLGLQAVSIDQHPADGRAHWWTFQAPLSWTPTVGTLDIWCDGHQLLSLDHRRQPVCLAAYSAATGEAGLEAALVIARPDDPATLKGAIAVLEPGDTDPLPEMVTAGAAGFVTAARDVEHRARLELPLGCPLFAFSVTPGELIAIRSAAARGARARVVVQLSEPVGMPLVQAVLPGEPGAEVWLTAHLCHPRPGANDNASGAACLVGVGAALARLQGTDPLWRPQRTIRFIWAPEFVGNAAALHGHLAGGGERPAAVVNMDVVGTEQSCQRRPLLLERPPDAQQGQLALFGEMVLSEVFAQTSNHPGSWAASPFAGFSDHLVFASYGTPAVQLCHAPDQLNHSAGDVIDAISAVELHRATATGVVLARIAAGGFLTASESTDLVAAWCRREQTASVDLANRYREVRDGRWSAGLINYVNHLTDVIAGRAPSCARDVLDQQPAGPPLRRCWSGPLNVRAMTADMPADMRLRVVDLIRSDKANLAVLNTLATLVDGLHDAEALHRQASFGMRRPLDRRTTGLLIGAMLESGWVAHVDAEAARP
jgi:Peptidase family M28